MSASPPPWSRALEEELPAWLLPASARQALDPAVAARALTRLSGRPELLQLLRRGSFWVVHAEAVRRFAAQELPALARVLPSEARVESRLWEGGFHGRLDIPATQGWHRAGHPTRFVTRARRRDFARPENVLVRVCAGRLRALCQELAREPGGPWNEGSWAVDRALLQVLTQTPLREVPEAPLGAEHLLAARAAAHPAYAAALRLIGALDDALTTRAPARIAGLLAQGALWPVQDHRRFELAVLVTLCRALGEHLGAAWHAEQCLILHNRAEVMAFHGPGGDRVAVYYDQAPGGTPTWRAQALGAYLGGTATSRPDITVELRRGEQTRWVLIECKLSEDPSYLRAGFAEAIVYRDEHHEQVSVAWNPADPGPWPQAVLVCSADLRAEPRQGDPIVAVDWRRWPPAELVAGMLAGFP